MPGWGTVAGFFFNIFGSKEERRRNKIERLEKEKETLLVMSETHNRRRSIERIDDELGRLYREAKNK